MIPEFDQVIGVRIPKKDRLQMEQLVKDGKFESISSIIREALDQFLN